MDTAQNEAKPAAKQKQGTAPAFATHMPLMSSAFDTAMWLSAA